MCDRFRSLMCVTFELLRVEMNFNRSLGMRK
jgi:hypothetical protein